VSNIRKEHLDLFRQYLLSHNEEVRGNFRTILPDPVLKYLLIIEEGFLHNWSIESIASNIDAQYLLYDLKQLKLEYYTSLAQIFSEGETNNEIELLLANDNPIFKNAVNEISDEIKFEKELSYAIKLTEREAFKKKFLSIDKEEEYHLSDTEIKSAISQLERKSLKQEFTMIDKVMEQDSKPASDTSSGKVLSFNLRRVIKYAAAAVILGFILLGGYYFINFKNRSSNSLAEKETTEETKSQPFTYSIPEISEQRKQMTLLLPQSYGFVKADKIYISIVIQNLGDQIDTLRKIYVKASGRRDSSEFTTGIKHISIQIDSLTAIGNTYLYNPETKKVILSLLDNKSVDKIISINPSQSRNLYLKLNSKYYKLLANSKHEKLIPIEDKAIIEELDKIVFQN